jgi:hypothetical protein
MLTVLVGMSAMQTLYAEGRKFRQQRIRAQDPV